MGVRFQDTNQDGLPEVVRVTLDAATSDACDASGWAAAADAAAVASGVDLAPYQHKIYVLPDNASCGWAGRGHLGCFGTCSAWVKRCNLEDVFEAFHGPRGEPG